MYQLVIYRNNEVFEPYIETTTVLRDTVKRSGGQFNTKTRRYQFPKTEYEDFLGKLAEGGLNFSIATRDLPSDKAGCYKPNSKKDVQVELKMCKDNFQMHLTSFNQDVVDIIKTLPVRNYEAEGERRWWQAPLDQYQLLCDLFVQNNISYQIVVAT